MPVRNGVDVVSSRLRGYWARDEKSRAEWPFDLPGFRISPEQEKDAVLKLRVYARHAVEPSAMSWLPNIRPAQHATTGQAEIKEAYFVKTHGFLLQPAASRLSRGKTGTHCSGSCSRRPPRLAASFKSVSRGRRVPSITWNMRAVESWSRKLLLLGFGQSGPQTDRQRNHRGLHGHGWLQLSDHDRPRPGRSRWPPWSDRGLTPRPA
jgi:hypothetical protein